jgi:hypothetical protein
MHWGSFTSYSLYFDGAHMTADQTEFLLAMAAYQKRFRRRFPTWLEALHVLHCLGYRKVAEPEPLSEPHPPKSEDDSPHDERREDTIREDGIGHKEPQETQKENQELS